MTGICESLNVLEIGSGSIAASIAGMVLADAGARVVKVEPPNGDRLRVLNPSGFLVWNRGKESVIDDLRTAAGQDEFRSMAAVADVVISGFAPGTVERWGISAEALRAANPKLVHCAISAFGRNGPYSQIKGYDSLVAAKTGLWSRGAFGHRPGAIMYPVPWGSFGAGMQSVAGILGALLVREQTGRGQSIDATLFAGIDPLDYFVATIVQLMAKKGETPAGDARSATAASRYGVLVVTRDGRFVQTSTLLPHQGRALCEIAGVGDILSEPRFSRLPMFDNADDAQAFEDILIEAFRRQDLDHWLPLLLASPDVAFEVAVTSEEALDHPQFVHNGDVITVDDPVLGPVRQVGPLCHAAESPLVVERSAPPLGANAGPLVSTPAPLGGHPVPTHPFSGITIVEFGYFYAMPYGVAMAAALGARVVKIEDASGDPHRTSFGQDVASNKTTAGKESLSIDLRTEEGRAIAHRLIESADVFITGFRSGVPAKLGLGYDELRAINPRLVYIHASGYGTDGPYAHRALYAQAAQAVAGSFGRQVGYWSDPSLNIDMSVPELQAIVIPRLGQVVDGDSNAALIVLASLALALYDQQRTGRGQFIRTSMIAGNAWCYSDDFCTYAGKPRTPLCDDEYLGTAALDRVYPAADGTWVCLAVRTDAEFSALAELLGVTELSDDPQFADAAARASNDESLVKTLAACFVSRSSQEWEAASLSAGVGCVAVNMAGQPVFTSFDPGLREAGLTVGYTHPLFGELVRAAPPLTFSETPGRVAPPCVRGEHNHTILSELGFDDAGIARLEAAGVVIPSS